MTKCEMRKIYLSKRNLLENEEIKICSKLIHKKIFDSNEYKNCDWIFTYINIGSEVETITFIERAWSEGKMIAVPVVLKSAKEIYFAEIKSFEGLKRTNMGILEPCIEVDNAVIPKENTIFITPGSVFDIHKNRCGYGGGYYDKYFNKYNKGIKIGIAFDFQVIEKIYTCTYDIKQDIIITDKRIIV